MILKAIIDFHRMAEKLIRDNVPLDRIAELPVVSKLKRVKLDDRRFDAVVDLLGEMKEELSKVAGEYRLTITFD